MRNDLPTKGPKMNESCIVNLDSEEGPGTHWVAYKKRGSRVIYFDSYGNLKPPRELQNYLRNCEIKYNNDVYQRSGYNCGHLCLKFLNKRFELY